MSLVEGQLPFAYSLRGIATEILEDVEVVYHRSVKNNTQMLVTHLGELRSDGIGRTRYQTADALMTNDHYLSSSMIVIPTFLAIILMRRLPLLSLKIQKSFVHGQIDISDIFSIVPLIQILMVLKNMIR